MKITPLVQLGLLRIPALTDLFSDALPVASLTVSAGNSAVVTTSAKHGLTIGSKLNLAVIDALTPNPIIAAELMPAGGLYMTGDVLLTTQFEHTLTTTPDATNYTAWDAFAILAGFGIVGLDGNRQLVSVPAQNMLVVRPSGPITLPGSVPGGAVLNQRLERDIIGFHSATVTSTTALTFPTPASITRSYTVTNPKVATNIRILGAVDFDHAQYHFTRDNEAEAAVFDQAWLFITPTQRARLARDRNSHSDAVTEDQPGTFIRQLLMDGFTAFAVLPAERYAGAVGCMDIAQGPIFTAMLRTFNGLRLPYTELAMANSHIAQLTSHGVVKYNRANYWHSYTFDVSAYLSIDDQIPPTAMPDLAAIDEAIQNGTWNTADHPIPTTTTATGSVPMGGITFVPTNPNPKLGIYQEGQPEPLTATVTLPE
jgi:hypothetical protein